MAKADLRPDLCNTPLQCYLWPAGKLGARFVAYISFRSGEPELSATFTLMDTRFGRELASETISGTAPAIAGGFQARSVQFFTATQNVSDSIGSSPSPEDDRRHRPMQPGVRIHESGLHDSVARIVRAHWNDIKDCTQNGIIASHPRVLVRFEIGQDGDVTQASLPESPHLPPETSECILKNVRGWKFVKPPRGEPVLVNYPFVFD